MVLLWHRLRKPPFGTFILPVVACCKTVLMSVFFLIVEPVLAKETNALQRHSALGKLYTESVIVT